MHNFDIALDVIAFALAIYIAIFRHYEIKTQCRWGTMPREARRATADRIARDFRAWLSQGPMLGYAGQPLGYSVVDLGSGNGRLACDIAAAVPDVVVVGYELNPILWALSRFRAWRWGLCNVEFRRRDFWKADFGEFDAAVMYLPANLMPFLSRKLLKQLPEGALIISQDQGVFGIRCFEQGPGNTFCYKIEARFVA